MKLTYLFHSGFLIEDNGIYIIVDYFNPHKDKNIINVIETAFEKSGKYYVLCSHRHGDHFSPEILKWRENGKDIKYIFSNDILLSRKNEPSVNYIEKDEIYSDHFIKIKAYGSTDEGISFFINFNDKKIFHAGDLNNWHWNEESTEEEIKNAEDWYYKELNHIKSEIENLDLLMFPIDNRLGKDYMKGAMEFLDEIKVKLFSPMHFGENYSSTWKFEDYAKSKNCKLIKWEEKCQSNLF